MSASANEHKLAEPYDYIKGGPRKSLRSKLIDEINVWIGVDKPNVVSIIKQVIEKLHNASLMIDDIEDSSELRRGQPSAHIKFGLALTINSANLAYFEALQLLQSIEIPKLSVIFCGIYEEMITLHKGQGLEIFYRENCIRPSMEEYLNYCSMKTGGLFKLAARLLIECLRDRFLDTFQVDLIICLTEKMGTFYQIRDDYLNIFCESAEDLKEGKFTLPTIHAALTTVKCESLKEREEVVKYLREQECDIFCKETIKLLRREIFILIENIEILNGKVNLLKDFIESLIIN